MANDTSEPLDDLRESTSQAEDTEDAYVQFEIATYPSDFTLKVLHDKWNDGEIVIPPFQRGYVWTQEQASRLVESFLLGLPVPPLFLYIDESKKSLVIDGQQRLKSMFFFFEGYFGDEDPRSGKRQTFRLKGLHHRSPFNNLTYDELGESAQVALKDSVLRAINVKQLSPSKQDTSIYYIFERLNTGGTRLRPQEVRHCVFRGTLNDLLREINHSNSGWRAILGTTKPNAYQRDVELLLRVAAFDEGLNTYERPLKEFLNQFMKKHQNPPQDWLERMRDKLVRTIATVAKHLGEKPFHVRGPLNAAALDSAMCTVMRNVDLPQDGLAERFFTLRADPAFVKLISTSTSDEASVKDRFRMTSEQLYPQTPFTDG